MRQPASDYALVFIHGFAGSAAGTWGSNDGSWPELVVADARFVGAGVFLCEYESKLDSGKYGFEEATRQVMTQLEVASTSGPKLTDCETILFVGHSAGGIISRNVLVQNLWSFRGKRIGLALVGSPSKGSGWADVGVALRDAAGSLPVVGDMVRSISGGKQLGQLTTSSLFLHALDAKFQFLIDNKFLTIVGREFVEHKGKFTGTPVIVSKQSAAVYYTANAVTIATSNHASICRPSSLDAQAHQELVRLWHQLLTTIVTVDEGVKQTEAKLRNEADHKLFGELQTIFSRDHAGNWLDWSPGISYMDDWLQPAWNLEHRAKQLDCFFHDDVLQAAHEQHLLCLRAFTSAIANENESLSDGRGRIKKYGQGTRSATDPHKDRYDEALERVEIPQDKWISAYDDYIKTFKRRLIL